MIALVQMSTANSGYSHIWPNGCKLEVPTMLPLGSVTHWNSSRNADTFAYIDHFIAVSIIEISSQMKRCRGWAATALQRDISVQRSPSVPHASTWTSLSPWTLVTFQSLRIPPRFLSSQHPHTLEKLRVQTFNRCSVSWPSHWASLRPPSRWLYYH